MSQAKRVSKGKRPSKALSVLGIAGASLAASTSGSLGDISATDIPSQNVAPHQFMAFGDEEIFDVSLATFHLFDKEGLGAPRSGIQLARGGCGCGHGCGGHGCGGARGCGGCAHGGCAHGGCRGCGRGCGRGCAWGGCGWGGCGGCGVGWGLGGCCLSWGGCSPFC